MRTLFRLLLATVVLFLGLASESAAGAGTAEARLTVHVDRPGPMISPMLYGIFFEEINCAGDGGLYAELVRNRSFEDSDKLDHWDVEGSGAEASVREVDRSAFNRRALKIVADEQAPVFRLINHGYWGIAVRKGESYRFSFEAKADAEVPLEVSLEGRDGTPYCSKRMTVRGGEWKGQQLLLKSSGSDPAARLVITLRGPGTVWLDMVSLFPRNTWNERENGLRPDLAGMLDALKPAFVRFPGGCWVEGDNMSLAYRWKETIGKLSDRRTQYNIWQYNSTHGLGFHEYLQLCKDLGAEPLFVINCGMSHREVVPMEQLGPYVQDALDAIEYANGAVTSTWGALRAANGHPQPFNLRFLQIGNENGGPAYDERYAAFYRAIKLKHPEVTLIANEWQGRPKSAALQIVDEHYYSSPTFFIQNSDKYDSYPREGPKIYVGEYAVTQNSGQGNLRGALGEAAFMTGMERNSDVVVMASYAPLFANLNYKKWNPDLINFDSSRVYGTPSYYVQKLFGENLGEVILPTELEAAELAQELPSGGVGLGTWATQAEFRKVDVSVGGNSIYSWKAGNGLGGWRNYGGRWEEHDGALRQAAGGEDRRLTTGDAGWQDYTLKLQARKIGGAEGFLILFRVKDNQNWLWWNLGGWGNTQHAIEKCSDGGKAILGQSVPGKIETGRWYDIRIEVAGQSIRCYLDDQLVHQVQDNTRIRPLHAVANWAVKPGEVILKVVNVSATEQATQIQLNGVQKVRPRGVVTVLTSSSPTDENTLEDPRKVAPATKNIQNVAPEFRHTFPAHSLSVLRIQAKK
jgi:alpha-L-arabinofuranosidase